MKNAWVRVQVYTGFWWGHLRETNHLDDPGIDWRIILRWIFRSGMGGGGIDWIDLSQETGGEHLQTW